MTALERVSQVLVVLVLFLLAAGVVLAVFGSTREMPASKNASFVDNIFASWIVILAARIALLFGAAYIAVSVVGLITSRRWLAQLGPFKASDPVVRFDRDVAILEEEMRSVSKAIRDLEHDLSRADRVLSEGDADNRLLPTQVDVLAEQQRRDHGTG